MQKNSQKNWTILIYTDGNNELEPEMWKNKLNVEKIGSDDRVHVVMQIGREARGLVKKIRPFDYLPPCKENWTGVRRYSFVNGKSVLLEDLGKINMADPMCLYDFIKWGIESFPSQHYMLILGGGHGFQYVGTLMDYSQNIPYLMGIPEMCTIFDMIYEESKVNIDLLIIDTCHFNSVEVLYELGKIKIILFSI
jgi:hypothetical protein